MQRINLDIEITLFSKCFYINRPFFDFSDISFRFLVLISKTYSRSITFKLSKNYWYFPNSLLLTILFST